jgi:hypothetical protein
VATVFWDRKDVLMVDGIHATRDHNNIIGVLRNTEETAYGHLE